MSARVLALDAAAIAAALSKGGGNGRLPAPSREPERVAPQDAGGLAGYLRRAETWETGYVVPGFKYRRAVAAQRIRGPFREHRGGNGVRPGAGV